jgi:hypothetical protein
MGPSNERRRSRLAVATTLAVALVAGGLLYAASRGFRDQATLENVLHGVCWVLMVGGVAGTFLAGAGVRCGWLILLLK